MDRRYVVVGIGAVLVIALLIFAAAPRQASINVQSMAKEWNLPNIYGGRISKCAKFATIDNALAHFGLPGPLAACSSDVNRLIRFYDEGNVHGFLTCYPMGGVYFCCAQLAEGYTRDYNTWKERCS